MLYKTWSVLTVKQGINLIMLQNFFFETYCFSPDFLFFILFIFSSQIVYHGPGIGCMKMPLGMDDPLGQ